MLGWLLLLVLMIVRLLDGHWHGVPHGLIGRGHRVRDHPHRIHGQYYSVAVLVEIGLVEAEDGDGFADGSDGAH